MLKHADKDFAVYRDERYTFGEAYAWPRPSPGRLVEDYGVRKGDRVAILSRNNPQWMMAFIAALSIGAVAVPMNAWWTTEELDYGLRDCGREGGRRRPPAHRAPAAAVGPAGPQAHRHR
jgi:long-chain acyl-CoA synthetase